jgi:hypothetical protein
MHNASRLSVTWGAYQYLVSHLHAISVSILLVGLGNKSKVLSHFGEGVLSLSSPPLQLHHKKNFKRKKEKKKEKKSVIYT